MSESHKIEVDQEEFAALISSAFLLAEEDTYLTKKLLFLADSWLAVQADGGEE